MDGLITPDERVMLGRLQSELGLDDELAAGLEREALAVAVGVS